MSIRIFPGPKPASRPSLPSATASGAPALVTRQRGYDASGPGHRLRMFSPFHPFGPGPVVSLNHMPAAAKAADHLAAHHPRTDESDFSHSVPLLSAASLLNAHRLRVHELPHSMRAAEFPPVP